MRAFRRSVVLSAVIAGLLLLPHSGLSASEDQDPFATFDHTANLTPVGASLRPNTNNLHNSDLAFWGDTAYQGHYGGFRILDVSDRAKPEVINDYTGCAGTSASNQGDLIVWEDLLIRSWNSPTTSLVSCGGQPVLPGFEGLHVFDVSDPQAPALLASVPLPCGSHTATGVPDPDNGRLLVYNSASTIACPWISIVSVPLSNPGQAMLAGLAPTGRACHDTAVILGEAMLAACAGGNGFTVLSLGGERGGSLTSPEQLYSVSLSGVTIGHAASFSWDGEVLAFGHEPGGGAQARCRDNDPDNLKSIFFFDTADGTELGRWVLPRPQTPTENCTIHNFNVVPTTDGSRILVSGNYQSGIGVVDFTDPANAVEIAYADPAPLTPTQLGGDWSSYWYDGYIYQSDITRGLLIWELDDDRLETAEVLAHLNPQTQEHTITEGA